MQSSIFKFRSSLFLFDLEHGSQYLRQGSSDKSNYFESSQRSAILRLKPNLTIDHEWAEFTSSQVNHRSVRETTQLITHDRWVSRKNCGQCYQKSMCRTPLQTAKYPVRAETRQHRFQSTSGIKTTTFAGVRHRFLKMR